MANSIGSESPEQISTPIEADSPTDPRTRNDSGTSQEASASVYKFEKENGRTYHGYRAGCIGSHHIHDRIKTNKALQAYLLPNDDVETDRMDLNHHILKVLFSNKNYLAPISEPERILDVGTGTGIWAIEMGDEFPSTEVQGTDLSPIQPDEVPDNVHFFIDDASEADWAVPESYYDYIHTRLLLGCFADFGEILKKAYHYTKPGGYVESQEMMSMASCDDGTMPRDWIYLEWLRYMDQAFAQAGRPLRTASKLKKWYQEAGFVDIQEQVLKLPLSTWPRDKTLKHLGAMSQENIQIGLSGFSLGPLSRMLNWSKPEIEVYLVNVRKALADTNVHAYHRIHVVWGRKPLPGEVSTSRKSC